MDTNVYDVHGIGQEGVGGRRFAMMYILPANCQTTRLTNIYIYICVYIIRTLTWKPEETRKNRLFRENPVRSYENWLVRTRTHNGTSSSAAYAIRIIWRPLRDTTRNNIQRTHWVVYRLIVCTGLLWCLAGDINNVSVTFAVIRRRLNRDFQR